MLPDRVIVDFGKSRILGIDYLLIDVKPPMYKAFLAVMVYI